ncbi:MAG: hypothetical protein ACJ8M4_11950, partial [Chthoniobacterales bacterium]
MSDGAAEFLLPELLQWARNHDWTRFTSVQHTTFRDIAIGNADLIIGGATSSGKTEAVFFPLISAAAKRKGG